MPDRKHCVFGLAVGLGGSSVRLRITGVQARGGRAEVSALANGAPGKIVLVRENGRFRVRELRAASG